MNRDLLLRIVMRGAQTTRNTPNTAEKPAASVGFQLSASSYEGQLQDQLLRCR
jgi:hypothetical protein